MVAVALLLVEQPRPRRLEVVELPGVPDMGDALEHSGRGYEVVGRGWDTNPNSTMKMKAAKVAIFLKQISGPPHVIAAGAIQ